MKNAPAQNPAAPHLTEREMEILTLMSEGLAKSKIARQLHITENTVAYHVKHIYEKLEVPNAPAAVNRGHRLGLFPND